MFNHFQNSELEHNYGMPNDDFHNEELSAYTVYYEKNGFFNEKTVYSNPLIKDTDGDSFIQRGIERGITKEKAWDVLQNGNKYFDPKPKHATYIKFKDNVAVSYREEGDHFKLINTQYQSDGPTPRWIPK